MAQNTILLEIHVNRLTKRCVNTKGWERLYHQRNFQPLNMSFISCSLLLDPSVLLQLHYYIMPLLSS